MKKRTIQESIMRSVLAPFNSHVKPVEVEVTPEQLAVMDEVLPHIKAALLADGRDEVTEEDCKAVAAIISQNGHRAAIAGANLAKARKPLNADRKRTLFQVIG